MAKRLSLLKPDVRTITLMNEAKERADYLQIPVCNGKLALENDVKLGAVQFQEFSFSKEAIAQLIIELEKHSMDKLVIFAGYGGPKVREKDNKMKVFLDANPGIKSRICRQLCFQTYCRRLPVWNSRMACRRGLRRDKLVLATDVVYLRDF